MLTACSNHVLRSNRTQGDFCQHQSLKYFAQYILWGIAILLLQGHELFLCTKKASMPEGTRSSYRLIALGHYFAPCLGTEVLED